MKDSRFFYRTVTGKELDLSRLDSRGRDFLRKALEAYEAHPRWPDFYAFWRNCFQKWGLNRSSLSYRVCEDLEARLVGAQETAQRPMYRDELYDIIQDEFEGSQKEFCEATGLDRGHLCRVLSGQTALSIEKLEEVAQKVRRTVRLVPIDETQAHEPQRIRDYLQNGGRAANNPCR